jgi:hypothetical protein
VNAAPSGSPAPSGASDETPACPATNQSSDSLDESLDYLYGLKDLRQGGLTGNGGRVGLLEVDTYSPRAMELYSKCFGVTPPPVELVSANARAEQLRPTNAESFLDLVALSSAEPGLSKATLNQFDGHFSLVCPLARVFDLQLDS